MKWASRYYKSIFVFLVIGTSIASGMLLTSRQVNADAATGSTGIASLAERWLRYRAITGCYSIHDVGSSSVDKISAGTWLARGGGSPDDKVALGYLNDDGKVSCGDGDFVSNSLSTIGFSSNLESFCAMRTATRGGSHDATRCADGPGEFDMDKGQGEQVQAFKDAKGAKVADSPTFPYDAGAGANQSIMYYIGLQSLKKFCGGSRGEKYTDSMAGNVGDAKRKVVVNEVDLADGKTVRYVYNLDKDETDNIDRLWSNTGRDLSATLSDGGHVVKDEEKSCAELAQLTWKYDDAFSAFVKNYNTNNPTDAPKESTLAGTDGAGSSSDKTTCAVDGIGWIVCPVMTFLGKLNDLAFGFLNNFLEVRPAVFNDKVTFSAWGSFRNIANVAFVIAFLVIIYSQITGGGMSNYGLKKLLPKLIIAAILVNISFWVCAVLIDLSNIAGSSLYSLLTGFNIGDDGGGGGTMSSIWSVAVAGLLGVAIGIGLLALIIFAPMSLLAFAVVILILIARQALVILLIVISPLAFVAYLLPNTESWFKKWWKALTGTLMVYPIIALVFGASTLASTILMRVAEDGVGGGDDEQMLKIIAAAVLALPLFAVPTLLKGSMAAAGTLGAKLSGLQDKASGKAGRAVKEGRLGEAKNAFDARRQVSKLKRRRGGGRVASWGSDPSRKDTRLGKTAAFLGTRQKAFDESSAGQYLGGNRGAAAATSALFKEYGDEVNRQKTLASGRTNEDLLGDLKSGKGSEEYQAAIAGTIMSRHHRESHLEALDIMMKRNQAAEDKGDTKALETVNGVQKQMYSDMKDKPFAVGDQAAGQLENGVLGRKNTDDTGTDHQYADINEQLQERVGTKLSAQSLATMNPDEMKRIHAAAMAGKLQPNQMNSLALAISEARTNKQMDALIKPEARALHEQILAKQVQDKAAQDAAAATYGPSI